VNKLIESLLRASLHDPFALLGLHRDGKEWVIRAYEPLATQICLLSEDGTSPLKQIHAGGLFEWRGTTEPQRPYRLQIFEGTESRELYDPYQFPSHLSEQDLHLFTEGSLHQGYRMLGSHAVMP
jgi:1,4-alpha-glucan branching enzyme